MEDETRDELIAMRNHVGSCDKEARHNLVMMDFHAPSRFIKNADGSIEFLDKEYDGKALIEYVQYLLMENRSAYQKGYLEGHRLGFGQGHNEGSRDERRRIESELWREQANKQPPQTPIL